MKLIRICVAIALLFPSSHLAAQQRTGQMQGTIYDDQGMPMAGAKVSVSSPTQIGGERIAISTNDGGFRFLGLMPGVFTVRVSKSGFVTAIRKDVRISVNKTITLDILLDLAPSPRPSAATAKPGKTETTKELSTRPKAETYLITATRPVVDVTKATIGETVSDEYLESVPISGRSYQNVAGLTAGVTQQRNPKGSGVGNPSVAGGTYFGNTYTVDGMDITDPVTHTFSSNFNFDAMADVNIMTGGMGPEFSDTPGGVINMATKSGSNQFELDTSVYYQNDALTIKDREEKKSTFSNLDANINVGGPIIKDKLWYYTFFEVNQRTSTISPDPNKILPDHPSREYLGFKILGKLTWQINPKHKLVFWAQTDPASIANTEQLITVEPDAESHQSQYGIRATGAWEWLALDQLFIKTQLGFGWNSLQIFPESSVTDVPGISDIGTGVIQRNYSRETTDDRFRISLNSDATYFANDFFGEHEVKVGFRVQYLMNPSTEAYTGNELYHYQFGQPYSLSRYFLGFDEASTCDPNSTKYNSKKCAQGILETTVQGTKLIAFLQDRWQLPGYKRLRLIPGVALHFGNTINPDGETVTSFVTPTAHLNFAWDIFNNGKTVLRGGYNQYVDVGFLGLARFIGRDLIEYECNYDPETGTYSSNCRVGGQIRTVGKPQGPGFDENGNPIDQFNPDALTVPRVHEISLGLEREWFKGFSTGVDFQFRRYSNQWEDLETNVIWNEAGDDVQAFKNGKSEYIYDLETPDEAYRRYLGLTLFARKFLGNWQIMASYTWSRNEGTTAESYATVFLDRPRQTQYFEGYLPDDRRHVVKLTGWYRWGSLAVGGNIWLGTGVPYDRLFFNKFFNDYNDRQSQRGMDPKDLATPDDDKELRTPTTLQFDLKVSYQLDKVANFLWGKKENLELIGEIFNLFNIRTPTRYEERNLALGAATQWGDVIDRQDPFRVRFSLRYRY
ncbi:MAG: TonB-dependent receptor [Pseudomonadota bacterium]